MRVKNNMVWIIGLTLMIFAFGSVLHAESRGLTTYKNNNYGFKLSYPSDWEIKENYMNAAAIFLSKQDNASDGFRENVNVAVVKVPSGTDLSMIKEESIKQLGSLISNFNLEAEKPITWAGRNAYAIVYTGTMGNYHFRWQQVFTVVDDRVYTLSYIAEEKSYNKFFPYFNQIVASFSII